MILKNILNRKINYICPACKFTNSKKSFFCKSVNKHESKIGWTYFKCAKCFSIFLGNNINDTELAKIHYRFWNNKNKFVFSYIKKTSIKKRMLLNKWKILYKKKIKPQKKNSLKASLDIGCGDGSFVQYMKTLNYKSYGFDPSTKKLVLPEKTIRVPNISLSNISTFLPGIKFDILTFHDVFEHLTDHDNILKNIVPEIMNKNGKIFIKIPSSENIQFNILGSYAYEVMAPFHRVLFSQKGLAILISRNGFKIKSKFNSANSWGWLMSLFTKFGEFEFYKKLRVIKKFRKLDYEIDELLDNSMRKLGYDPGIFVCISLK